MAIASAAALESVTYALIRQCSRQSITYDNREHHCHHLPDGSGVTNNTIPAARDECP